MVTNWKTPLLLIKINFSFSRKVCGKTPGDIFIIKGRLHRILKSEYYLRHVCPSAWNNLNGTRQIVMKHNTWVHSENMAREMKELYNLRGRDSSVGIATRYGLDGPGIECRWGEIFLTYPERPLGTPSLLYNGYRKFTGGYGGRGVTLSTHPI